MQDGWIKLWRRLMDKGYYKKSEYVHLWIHLLFKANHNDEIILWNGEEKIIKRGQFITGRKKLSIETGIKQTTIERILNFFENGQQIGQQKTNLFRLITIINYEQLQKVDIKTDNKRTTNGQQTDTNKNEKNNKNINTLYREQADEVLNYLNEKLGKHFSKSDEIIARLKQGGTIEQCKQIIDTKIHDPLFIEKPSLLNPVTLFRKSHWDTYLNQKPEDFTGKLKIKEEQKQDEQPPKREYTTPRI